MGSEKVLAPHLPPSFDTAGIDSIIKRLLKTCGAPGAAIAVIRGDETYLQGYGTREKNGSAPITPDTLFANASTTKAITTATIALLVDEGKMAWDDPVRKHLPLFRLSDPLADASVTIRDLVSHRTGLPRHDSLWYHTPLSRDEILRRIASAKLAAPIRSLYQYQNICFTAAGEAVRAAAGAESWEQFARLRLLGPLGMSRTTFSVDEALSDIDHASPHQFVKGKLKTTLWHDFGAIGGAGSMISSVREMAKWARLNLSGGLLEDGSRLLSESVMREMRTPQTVIRIDDETRARYPHVNQMSYGLGWSIWSYRDGSGIMTHGGALDGFRAQVALIPDLKIGVVIFANLGKPFAEIARNAILDQLFGLPSHDWNGELKAELKKITDDESKTEKERREQRLSGKPSPITNDAYLGTYVDPTYGTVTVSRDGKKGLKIAWISFERTLTHQTFTTFLAEPSKDEAAGLSTTEVKFVIDPEGKITRLLMFEGEFLKAEKKVT